MKTLQLIGIIFFSLLIYNCSSDDDNMPQNDIIPTQSIKLTGVITGTLETLFNYDENDRLTSYTYSGVPSNIIYDSEGKIIQFSNYTYNYDSLDRVSGVTQTNSALFTNIATNYTYNNNNLVLTSYTHYTYSSSGTTNYIERQYEYNTDNKITTVTETASENSYSTKVKLFYNTQGNVSQIINEASYDDGLTYTITETQTFSYDNKKNPGILTLNKLGIDNPQSIFNLAELYDQSPENYVFFRTCIYNNNNITQVAIQGDSYSSLKEYDYVYNEFDYPISAEVTHSNGDVTSKNWIYEITETP